MNMKRKRNGFKAGITIGTAVGIAIMAAIAASSEEMRCLALDEMKKCCRKSRAFFGL